VCYLVIATEVTAAYRQMDDLVTCGLTACTPGSAPGPTLGTFFMVLLYANHVLLNSIKHSLKAKHDLLNFAR